MTRRLTLLAVVLGLGATASVFSQNGPRLEVAARTAADPAPADDAPVCPRPDDVDNPRDFAGHDTCTLCHRSGVGDALGPQKWALGTEYVTWHDEDLHRQAYAVLHDERSKRMGEILNYDNDPNYAVHRDLRCLACHSGYPVERLVVDEKNPLLVNEDRLPNEVLAGVTCEGCHGPSKSVGRSEGWLEPHKSPDPWRFESPAVKWNTYGYVDVRSPLGRTRMCASCHIGNAAMGRVVTHEMYAAGHPPLPGFELDAFERDEPKHWMEIAEKNPAIVAEFLAKTKDPNFGPDFDVSSLRDTKILLAASLIGLAETMRLNAELASDQVAGPVEKGSWPELAQFDCYACHHDLHDTGWRFARQPVLSRPGRPTIREWPAALPLVAARVATRLDAANHVEKVDAGLTAVRELVGAKPFGGESHEFAVAACNVAEAADGFAAAIEAGTIPYAGGPAVLKDVAAVATDESILWDHDSARQLAWAFDSILIEMEEQVARSKKPGNAKWKIEPFAKTGALRQALRAMSDEGRVPSLDMTYTQPVKNPSPLDTKLENIREVDVRDRLESLNAYDAYEFRKAFGELAGMLD